MDSINYDALASEQGLFVPSVLPGNPFLEIWRNGAGVSSTMPAIIGAFMMLRKSFR